MDTSVVVGLVIAALPTAGAAAGGVWLYMRHTTQAQVTAAATNADGRIAEMAKHTDARVSDLQAAWDRERTMLIQRHTYEVETLRGELAEARSEVRQLNATVAKAANSLEKNAASQDALVTLMHHIIPKAAATD